MSTATSLGCTVHRGVARLPSALWFNGVARNAEAKYIAGQFRTAAMSGVRVTQSGGPIQHS